MADHLSRSGSNERGDEEEKEKRGTRKREMSGRLELGEKSCCCCFKAYNYVEDHCKLEVCFLSSGATLSLHD